MQNDDLLRIATSPDRWLRRRRAAPLSFSYRAAGGVEFIDQTLQINNPGPSDVAPVLRFTAVDQDGRALPGVRVITAYGSDRGSLVVPPGSGYDVLAFEGPDADSVADVKVTVDDLTVCRVAGPTGYIDAHPVDGDGNPVSKFAAFDTRYGEYGSGLSAPCRLDHRVVHHPVDERVLGRAPVTGARAVGRQGSGATRGGPQGEVRSARWAAVSWRMTGMIRPAATASVRPSQGMLEPR